MAGLPGPFGAYEDAETFGQRFFPWYNLEHRHGAPCLMTPNDIHYGMAAAKWQQRAAVLRAAYAAPERFPRGVAGPTALPTARGSTTPAMPTLRVPRGGRLHDGCSQIFRYDCLHSDDNFRGDSNRFLAIKRVP